MREQIIRKCNTTKACFAAKVIFDYNSIRLDIEQFKTKYQYKYWYYGYSWYHRRSSRWIFVLLLIVVVTIIVVYLIWISSCYSRTSHPSCCRHIGLSPYHTHYWIIELPKWFSFEKIRLSYSAKKKKRKRKWSSDRWCFNNFYIHMTMAQLVPNQKMSSSEYAISSYQIF